MRYIVIASLIAVVGTQVSAQGISHHATIAVSKSDVTAGKADEALRQRIATAIERVCGPSTDVTNVEQFAEASRCRRAARADIDRQLANLSSEIRIAARAR